MAATLSGPDTATAGAVLGLHGFRWTGERTLALARIDRDEHHHTEVAVQALHAQGITVDLSPRLRHAIDTDWCFTVFPGMDHVDRTDIRELAATAQQIHEDITSGRLVVHAHAHDPNGTTVALATYLGSDTIELRNQDHLRHITATHPDLTVPQALAQFQQRHHDTVRPGPAPATDTEKAIAAALTPTPPTPATPALDSGVPAAPVVDTVPVYAADPGDHEQVLTDFFAQHGDWEKVRTWGDSTTIANHESLALRALFDHDADGRDTKWTFAAYEDPVSDLLWHGRATASTPVTMVGALLEALATENVWSRRDSAGMLESAVAEATIPLADAAWKHTIDGRYVSWVAPGPHEGGVQFDAFPAQQTNSPLPTWTIWGGHAADQPIWALQLSAHAPAALVQRISFAMAEAQGTRRVRPSTPGRPELGPLPVHAPEPAPPPTMHLSGPASSSPPE